MENKQKTKRFLDVKIDKTNRRQSRHLVKIRSKAPQKIKIKKFDFHKFLKFLNELINKNEGKEVSREEIEKIKMKAMWSGVTFFMILVLFLWSLSLRASLQKYNQISYANVELEETYQDFADNIEKFKENLKKIKEIKQELVSTSTNSFQGGSTSTNEAATEKEVDLDLLRAKLEEAINLKKTSSSSKQMIINKK